VTVLRERRVIWHLVRDTQSAEPPIGQVQVNLFAQLTLRANAQAVTDQQHADHQLRIDRGSAGVAVVRRQVFAQIGEVEETIDGSQQVILGDEIFEVKRVEQLVLRFVVAAHHRTSLRQSTLAHYLINLNSSRVFQRNRPLADPQVSFVNFCFRHGADVLESPSCGGRRLKTGLQKMGIKHQHMTRSALPRPSIRRSTEN
jgi:hypothetical protein